MTENESASSRVEDVSYLLLTMTLTFQSSQNGVRFSRLTGRSFETPSSEMCLLIKMSFGRRKQEKRRKNKLGIPLSGK